MVDDANRQTDDPFSAVEPIRTNRNRGNLPLRESEVAEPILGGEIRDLSAAPPHLILSVAEKRYRARVNDAHRDASRLPALERKRRTLHGGRDLDHEMSRDEALAQVSGITRALHAALKDAVTVEAVGDRTTPLGRQLRRPTDIKAIGTTWAISMDKLTVAKAMAPAQSGDAATRQRPGVLALARRIAEAQTDLYP
jgi:hypothetical protein